MASRTLRVEILGDASSLERAFGNASRSSRSFGSSLGRVAKGAGIAAGAAGVAGLAVVLRQGIAEFSQAAKVSAQTAAVLKSTGGAANVTARDVSRLSEALMMQSGVDDELIQSGQNVLLTFTKIRNEAGRGNDVFKQATRATLDLSVALGKDMQSSAILVGKALNDPIRGMSALSRAGIQFTEAQRETVKQMVETGNVMGAQKVVLKELETQFGGSAKAIGDTLPGQINKLKETFNNLSGEIVGRLVPAANRLVAWAVTNMPMFEQKVQSAMTVASHWFRVVADFIQTRVVPIMRVWWNLTIQAVTAVGRVFDQNGPAIERILGRVGAAVSAVAKVMLFLAQNVVIPVLKPLFTTVIPTALNITIKVIDAATGAVESLIRAVKWVGNNVAGIFKTLAKAVTAPAAAMKAAIDGPAQAVHSLARAMYSVIDLADRFLSTLSRVKSGAGSVGNALLPGNPFGGGRAAGGPVTRGTAYLVGEQGPELFVPGRTGQIVPNARTATGSAGGGSTVINVAFPNYVGSQTELIETVRRGLYDIARRNPGALPGVA